MTGCMTKTGLGLGPVSAQVRRAVPDDVQSIARLLLELGYEGTEPQIRRRLDRVLRHPDHVVLVGVEPPHGVVGLLHACVQIPLTEPPFVWVMALVVSSAHRRTGVGRMVIDRLHSWASRRGVENILAPFATHREEAQRFFKGLGYQLEKTQRVFRRSLGEPFQQGPPTLMD